MIRLRWLASSAILAVYVVPQPGKRFNLADLVRDMPADRGELGRITDFSDKGDISGITWLSLFDELTQGRVGRRRSFSNDPGNMKW